MGKVNTWGSTESSSGIGVYYSLTQKYYPEVVKKCPHCDEILSVTPATKIRGFDVPLRFTLDLKEWGRKQKNLISNLGLPKVDTSN